jgi:hypothetical protein
MPNSNGQRKDSTLFGIDLLNIADSDEGSDDEDSLHAALQMLEMQIHEEEAQLATPTVRKLTLDRMNEEAKPIEELQA